MSGLRWNECYETGDETVDHQHIALFAAINELHEAIRHGRGDEMVTKTLIDLMRYTKTHFADEESLMEAVEYPRLAEHRLEHEALTDRVSRLAAASDRTHPLLLSVFCYDWLIGHIRAHDVPMIEYVRRSRTALSA